MNELLQFDRQSYSIRKILCKSILESLDSFLAAHEKYYTFTRGDRFLSIEFVQLIIQFFRKLKSKFNLEWKLVQELHLKWHKSD